ncbi:hypothetical protein [Streptomyces sp. NPDC001833]|uniref:hypothetical protein n=1 Tax=Streptomyces sp. NPDC001833 TaxID=3154658 RepID=UPI00332DBD27
MSDRQLDRPVREMVLRDEVPLADSVLAPGVQDDDPAVAEAGTEAVGRPTRVATSSRRGRADPPVTPAGTAVPGSRL